ncbi:MAG: hypothetical protein IJI57_04150 [Flexilinea sp.]|nr:hypothetical protein [Flexilinea sp.]
MADNVVIDINASTKQFESALDDLTAKVRSTAAQMDKAFSVSGNAERSIKSTSSAVGELHNALKGVSLVAAGNLIADGFENAYKRVSKFGKQLYAQMENMQNTEMKLQSIVATEMYKTGRASSYQSAMAQAEKEKNELMAWFKEISLISPYQYTEVINSFMTNANLGGQNIETTKKTTKAILELGSGLGMTQEMMGGFSRALAQTGATSKITQQDLNQFANNGFGRDKMNAIFDIIGKKYNMVIEDHNAFNNAVKSGKIQIQDFYDALSQYASENYGGSVEAMASTIGGLKNSWGDIKDNALNDLFLEASKTLSKTLKPYIEYLMELLTGGQFTQWGQNINNWVQKTIEPLQKLGAELENGNMMRALNNLRDFFSGKSLKLDAARYFLKNLGGEEFADDWLQKLGSIKVYVDKFLTNKDKIIDAIKGIGIAFTAAMAVSTISKISGLLTNLLTSPVAGLTVAGAALGLAWNKNLFHIQERVGKLKDYVTDLYAVFKQKKWSGVWEKISTSASDAYKNILKAWDKNKGLSGIIKAEELDSIIQRMKTMFKNLFEINIAHNPAVQYVTDIINAFKEGGIEGVFTKIKTDIENVVADIVAYKDKIVAAYKEGGIIGALRTIGDDIGEYLEQSFLTAYEKIKANAGQLITGFFGEDAGRTFMKNLSAIELYFKDLSVTYKKEGLTGVFEQITTDITNLVAAHKEEWYNAIKSGAINVVGVLFGEDSKANAEKAIADTEKYVNEIGNAYENGGLAGVFDKITTDLETYVNENKGTWEAALQQGAVDVVGILFGTDAENRVNEFINELNKSFETDGWSGVGTTIGTKIWDGLITWIGGGGADGEVFAGQINEMLTSGDRAGAFEEIGHRILENIVKGLIDFSDSVIGTEFTQNLKKAFGEGGLEAVGEELGKELQSGITEVLVNIFGEENRETITQGLEYLQEKIQDIVDSITETLQKIGTKFEEIFDDEAIEDFRGSLELLGIIAAIVGTAILNAVPPAIKGIGQAATDIMGNVRELFNLLDSIKDIFVDLYSGNFDKLEGDYSNLADASQRLIDSLILTIENLFANVLTAVIHGIGSIIPGGDAIVNWWDDHKKEFDKTQEYKQKYGIAAVDNALVTLHNFDSNMTAAGKGDSWNGWDLVNYMEKTYPELWASNDVRNAMLQILDGIGYTGNGGYGELPLSEYVKHYYDFTPEWMYEEYQKQSLDAMDFFDLHRKDFTEEQIAVAEYYFKQQGVELCDTLTEIGTTAGSTSDMLSSISNGEFELSAKDAVEFVGSLQNGFDEFMRDNPFATFGEYLGELDLDEAQEKLAKEYQQRMYDITAANGISDTDNPFADAAAEAAEILVTEVETQLTQAKPLEFTETMVSGFSEAESSVSNIVSDLQEFKMDSGFNGYREIPKNIISESRDAIETGLVPATKEAIDTVIKKADFKPEGAVPGLYSQYSAMNMPDVFALSGNIDTLNTGLKETIETTDALSEAKGAVDEFGQCLAEFPKQTESIVRISEKSIEEQAKEAFSGMPETYRRAVPHMDLDTLPNNQFAAQLKGNYDTAQDAINNTLTDVLTENLNTLGSVELDLRRQTGLDYLEKLSTDYKGFTPESEVYAREVAHALEKSTLPDVLTAPLESLIQNSIENGYTNTEQIAGALSTFVKTAGEFAVTAAESTAEQAEELEKPDWNMFTNYLAGEQDKYYNQFKTAIRTQMVENGFLGTGEDYDPNKFAKAESAKSGSKEYKEYMEAYQTALNQLLALEEGDKNRIKAFDFEKYNTVESLIGQRLNELYIDMGETIDGFSTITSENFADAISFMREGDIWQEFADRIAWGGELNPQATFTELFGILDKLSSNPEWVSSFKADTLTELEKLSTPEEKMNLLMTLVGGLDDSIDRLNADNAEALKDIASRISGRTAATGETKGQAMMQEIINSWDNAETPEQQKMFENMLQATIGALYYDDNDDTYSGWLSHLGDMNGVQIPTAVDILNQGVEGEAWKQLWNIAGNGLFSDNAFNELFAAYQKYDLDRAKAAEQQKAEVDSLIANAEGGKVEAGETKHKGILSALLGEDFDITELGSSLFSGLAESLDEDTIAGLGKLADMEMTADKAKGWIDLAAAMETLGGAMQALSSVFGMSDEMANGDWFGAFVESMTNLLAIEMDETKLSGWLGFGESMMTVGTELQSIAMAFGLLSAGAMEGMSAEMGVSMGATMEGADPMAMAEGGLVGMLTALAGMEFNLDGWAGFAEALLPVQEALTVINELLGVGMEEEGAEGSIGMLGALQALLTMMTETFPPAVEGFADLLSGTLPEAVNTALQSLGMFQIDEEGNLGAAQGNTLYTSMGAIKGLIEDSNGAFYEFVRYLSGEIPGSVETFKKAAEKITDCFANIHAMASAAAAAAWDLVAALEALDGMEIPGGGKITFAKVNKNIAESAKSSGDMNTARAAAAMAAAQSAGKAHAGGTSGWRYGTAIVGEHGPELLTNNGSRAWTVFSNNTLMDEIAHTRHALNALSNSAELVAYNRLMGGAATTMNTDNRQTFNNNIGTVVGDNAFRDMVDDYLTRAMRREMLLAR